MTQSRKKLLLVTIYILSLYTLGLFLFPFWLVLLTIWFGLSWLLWKYKSYQSLTQTQKHVWITVIFLFPLILTVLKYFRLDDFTVEFSSWINRLEHFSFSLGLGLLLSPLVKANLKTNNYFVAALFLTGITITIGNFIEVFEYLKYNTNSEALAARFYRDTIYDLVMNIIGALIASLIMLLPTKK